MAEFKIGLKVRLISGGPIMTVTGVGTTSYADNAPDDRIWVQWFDEKNKLNDGNFPFDAVDIVA
jgi:uncharacterized protein YodC (DUF2158 family)